MTVIGGDRSRLDRLRQLRIAPSAARLFVDVIDIREEKAKFVEVAGVELLLLSKPEELIENEAAELEGSRRMACNIACQQPSLGLTRQICRADGRFRFSESKRWVFQSCPQSCRLRGSPDSKEAVCLRLKSQNIGF